MVDGFGMAKWSFSGSVFSAAIADGGILGVIVVMFVIVVMVVGVDIVVLAVVAIVVVVVVVVVAVFMAGWIESAAEKQHFRYIMIFYETLLYFTILYDILRYSAIHYNILRYVTILYDILRYITIFYDILQYMKIFYDILRFFTLLLAAFGLLSFLKGFSVSKVQRIISPSKLPVAISVGVQGITVMISSR